MTEYYKICVCIPPSGKDPTFKIIVVKRTVPTVRCSLHPGKVVFPTSKISVAHCIHRE